MNIYPLLFTIVGGLIVAGLLGWVRMARLVAVVPRTFSYSQITDQGHLVEISIFNRGLKTEESIDVTLNHALSYTLLGANSQEVSIEKDKVKITRIGPADDVTVLLIVEGGNFKADDILQIVSKETKGKTVSMLTEVPPTHSQRVGLVIFFVLLLIVLFGAYYGLEHISESSRQKLETTSKSEVGEPKFKSVGEWSVRSYQQRTAPNALKEFVDGRISATVNSLTQKGDFVTVPIKVRNVTGEMIRFSASMDTLASEKRIPSYERRVDGVRVFPGSEETREIKVVIPSKASLQRDRTIFIELSINSNGESLDLKQELKL